jgi:hypothetical protein
LFRLFGDPGKTLFKNKPVPTPVPALPPQHPRGKPKILKKTSRTRGGLKFTHLFTAKSEKICVLRTIESSGALSKVEPGSGKKAALSRDF